MPLKIIDRIKSLFSSKPKAPQSQKPNGRGKVKGQGAGGRKPEGRKAEGQKGEGRRPEGRKTEGPRGEGRRPEGRKAEGRRPEGRKAGGRRPEGKRPAGPKVEGPKVEGRKPEDQKTEDRTQAARKPRRSSRGSRGGGVDRSDFDYEPIRADNGDWTVDQFVVEPEDGRRRFHDFDIPVEIMHAIADLGFRYCTPIQAASLERAMVGENVAGRAQTGTGKTAAYLVSILTRYLRTPDKRQDKPATPRALVIAPTRELCVQICRDAQALGKYCGLRSLAVFGGMDYAKQSAALGEGVVDLIAATPGRLLDFQRSHVIDLSKIDTLVIDEADRMLDMGFIPDVRRIIRSLPTARQTLLYSATLSDDVMRLASQWMPNPVKVEIEPERTANQDIDQKVFIVTSDQKFNILCHLLERYDGQRVLIFANRRVSTDRLAERLRRHGYQCELLSGEVNQNHRMKVLDNFREGTVKIVVATDVAGRGLHIADIGLVVNFELPYEAEDYVHRIGRTGRAGKVGTSVSFADEDESFIIPDIEKFIGEELKCTVPDEDLLAPVVRRGAGKAD
ncbi:MAG: DEAD/DEAH box helicase [Kiritimatiellae bacterium]|nr:DEAD/DEAH box helicase [Kiritimatiellia bacterium]